MQDLRNWKRPTGAEIVGFPALAFHRGQVEAGDRVPDVQKGAVRLEIADFNYRCLEALPDADQLANKIGGRIIRLPGSGGIKKPNVYGWSAIIQKVFPGQQV